MAETHLLDIFFRLLKKVCITFGMLSIFYSQHYLRAADSITHKYTTYPIVLKLQTYDGSLYFSLEDLNNFWQIAKSYLPELYQQTVLTKEEKFKIMLFILRLTLDKDFMLKSHKALEAYITRYGIGIEAFNKNFISINSKLLHRIEKVDPKEVEICKFSFQTENLKPGEYINFDLKQIKKLAPCNLEKQVIIVPKKAIYNFDTIRWSAVNTSYFYSFPYDIAPYVKSMSEGDTIMIQDRAGKVKLLYLKSKQAIPLIYKQVCIYRTYVPFIISPNGKIDKETNLKVAQSLIDRSMLNVHPTTDTKFKWVKNYIQLVGYEEYTQIMQQHTEQLIKEIYKGNSIYPALLNKTNDLQINSYIGPLEINSPKDGEQGFVLLYIDSQKNIEDKKFVWEYLEQLHLLSAENYASWILNEIRVIVDSNIEVLNNKIYKKFLMNNLINEIE